MIAAFFRVEVGIGVDEEAVVECDPFLEVVFIHGEVGFRGVLLPADCVVDMLADVAQDAPMFGG